MNQVLVLVSFLFIVLSCQKDESFLHSSMNMEVYTSAEINATSVLYFPSETFTIVSKDPLVQSRSLASKNYKYFENFILKVQNGSSGKTKVPKIEILLDGITIVTHSDFRKNTNIVSKTLTGLTPTSTLMIKLDGSKGRFIKVLIECSLQPDVITDIDNNYYHTVKIGNRWWTTENLRTTRFNDGSPIELNEDLYMNDFTDKSWYCFYKNDESFKDVYGALYSSPVASEFNEKQVCPTGWHVSNFEDLLDAVHSIDPDVKPGPNNTFNSYVGGEFKERGLEHWIEPNTDATNSTGFTGLPGGSGWGGEAYYNMRVAGFWWIGLNRWFDLFTSSPGLDCVYYPYAFRCSIRWVKNY